jgi:hypothetical protein
MQEVFVKLLQKLEGYQERPGIPFDHWVSRLTVRTCLDALRAERARPEWRWADLGEGQEQWLEFLINQAAPAPEALIIGRTRGGDSVAFPSFATRPVGFDPTGFGGALHAGDQPTHWLDPTHGQNAGDASASQAATDCAAAHEI